jgi:Flp pilus assembly protein TadG
MLKTRIARRNAASPGGGVKTGSRGARPRNQGGQTLLEFALMLPALLLLVMGMITFGFALNNYLILTNATSVSAQQLSFGRGQTTNPCSTAVNAFYAAAPTLVQANLKFTIVLDATPSSGGVTGGTTVMSNASGVPAGCTSTSTSTGDAGLLLQSSAAQVTVTYPCNLTVMGHNFAPNCLLTAQSAELVQ